MRGKGDSWSFISNACFWFLCSDLIWTCCTRDLMDSRKACANFTTLHSKVLEADMPPFRFYYEGETHCMLAADVLSVPVPHAG